MPTAAHPKTDYVGRVFNFTTSPDGQGWQVTYEVGVQGDELVVIGIAIRSVVGEAERILQQAMHAIPFGGLSAQRARNLVRPGTALREFLKAANESRLTWPVRRSEVEKMLSKRKGASWRTMPTPEFLDFVAWLKTLPAFKAVVRRGPTAALLTREQRKAQTAALYVQAIMAGERAPRAKVAIQQGRHEEKVRDDLHAARAENPPLLIGGASGKSGGSLTDRAIQILEEMQSAARPRRKGSTR